MVRFYTAWANYGHSPRHREGLKCSKSGYNLKSVSGFCRPLQSAGRRFICTTQTDKWLPLVTQLGTISGVHSVNISGGATVILDLGLQTGHDTKNQRKAETGP